MTNPGTEPTGQRNLKVQASGTGIPQQSLRFLAGGKIQEEEIRLLEISSGHFHEYLT